MDTIQHAAHGAGMVLIPAEILGMHGEMITILATTFALVGALPDILGELEPEEPGGKKNWNWYVECHAGAVNRWMTVRWCWLITLPWLLHTWLDRFTHGEGRRWWIWRERLWMEALGWIIPAGLWWLIR